jgi:ABC-type branched-subunit amino acid transport system ATPase component
VAAANRIVEHNPSVVASLSDHITVLARGQVLATMRVRVQESRRHRAYLGTAHA